MAINRISKKKLQVRANIQTDKNLTIPHIHTTHETFTQPWRKVYYSALKQSRKERKNVWTAKQLNCFFNSQRKIEKQAATRWYKVNKDFLSLVSQSLILNLWRCCRNNERKAKSRRCWLSRSCFFGRSRDSGCVWAIMRWLYGWLAEIFMCHRFIVDIKWFCGIFDRCLGMIEENGKMKTSTKFGGWKLIFKWKIILKIYSSFFREFQGFSQKHLKLFMESSIKVQHQIFGKENSCQIHFSHHQFSSKINIE